ncbi:MAG: polysaccharide deacetylase family protein [Chitinophagaceae bacterium]|nr:polysaccharide deacetylase family protein [Chitinophagaceae bacterium]
MAIWGIYVWVALYILSLVLGAIKIQWNFYLYSYNQGQGKQIALTFDDGPAEYTSAILDVLKEHNVKAAFFFIGKNIRSNAGVLKRAHNEGHVIGNHSFSHGFLIDLKTPVGFAYEIERTNAAVNEVIGVKPMLFRPPYGVTNPNVASAVTRTGMKSVGWSLRSYDTVAKDGSKLLDTVLSKLKGGDVILLHDSVTVTQEILTELIAKAQEKGFTFVRVDQLLDIEAYQ